MGGDASRGCLGSFSGVAGMVEGQKALEESRVVVVG